MNTPSNRTISGNFQQKKSITGSIKEATYSLLSNKERILSIRESLLLMLKKLLLEYEQVKHVRTHAQEFTGLPTVSEGFKVEFHENGVNLTIPPISDIQQRNYWELFDSKDFKLFIDDQAGWKYESINRSFRVKIRTENIQIILPPSQVKQRKNVHMPQNYDAIEGAKTSVISHLNSYLHWYYDTRGIIGRGIQKKSFQIEALYVPLRWKFLNNSLHGDFGNQTVHIVDFEAVEALRNIDAFKKFTAGDCQSVNIQADGRHQFEYSINGIFCSFQPFYNEIPTYNSSGKLFF